MKKLLVLLLTIVVVIILAPSVLAKEEKEIIDSFSCDKCSLSLTLYDDSSLLFDGDCIKSNHSHSYNETFRQAKKIIFSDTFRISNLYIDNFICFYLCEEYSVSKNNPYYSTIDGVLLNKDKSAILKYPQGKENKSYTTPQTVKEICWFAFSNYEENIDNNIAYLKEITFSSNIEHIASFSCMNSSLEKVVFENGDRTLIIGDYSFGNSKNLSNIILPADRVYSVVNSSFKHTAYYNDTCNWEKGVLYLEDIILDVKIEKMESTYTIRNGTKVIADLAAFGYVPPEANYCKPVEVTVPETLDNIGSFSIFNYKNFPENIFRLGTNYYTEPSSITGDYQYMVEYAMTQLEEDYRDLEKSYSNWLDKTNTSGELKKWLEFPDDCIYFTCVENAWIHHSDYQLSSGNFIAEIAFIEEGIKGLADETLHYSWFPNCAVTFACNGLILPESFEVLSGRTILDAKQYSTLLNYSELDTYYNDFSKDQSITFMNPNTVIFDNENTLWEGYTICGYAGSTAHEYALKYNRKFVDINNCSHNKTAEKLGIKATCKSEGIKGNIYCQYCGLLLKEGGEIIPKSEHKFNNWYIESNVTCTTDGLEYSKCSVCDMKKTRIYKPALGHNLYTEITEYPDCNHFGLEHTYCKNCSYENWVSLQKLEHNDSNNDGKCDNCNKDLTEGCGCNCHKTGISSIIYKIMKFFWKIFKTNKVCSCGVMHY